MPRKLTSREYDALVQRLERMADGIAKHKAEPDFPPRLKEDERRTARQQLEELRLTYENFMRQAERAYDAYSEHFTKCEADLSKDSDSLKGFYGKTSPMLADFGTTVQARPVGRAKKAPENNKP
ncbi:MAG: hypothetical protein HY774_19810 [Acidobacteria bacterium]|nr:hypothetical protein [Acidobacteriota bacterium]